MKKAILPTSLLLLSITWNPGQVLADGGGPCTYRAPTAQERAFFASLTTLRAAIPPAPDGWMLRENALLDPRHEDIPRQVCDEYTEHPLAIDAVYERAHDRAAEDDAMRRAQGAAPDEAALTAQIEPINAEIAKLTEQAMAAGGRGDFAAVDRLNAEVNVLSEKISKLFEATYAPQTAIVAEHQRDRGANLRIAVNQTREECHGQPQPIDIPGAVAYRCAHEEGYTPSGGVLDPASARTLIVIGTATVTKQDWPRWARDQREFTDQMIFLVSNYDRDQPLKVQNVVIRIDSDNPKRVDGLFRELKFDALKGLVGR